MRAPGLWAVMPVKNVENAKQRLAPALSPDERQGLFRAMVEDVLATLAKAKGLAGILMVTRDPDAIRLAERYGARTLTEPANAGHTAASTLGAQTLAGEGAVGMIQIPGDLPMLTAADIEAVIDAHGPAPAITIAPSGDELGSNAVACSPPDLLPLRFGDNSFVPHVERAKALGVIPAIVKRPGLALDIDTPDDLRAFLEAPIDGHSHRFLLATSLAARLGDQGEN